MTSKNRVVLVVGALIVAGVAGSVSLTARWQAGRRAGLVGWYELPSGDHDTRKVIPGPGALIPVFRIDGTYYSVCLGFEVPLKECAEGLEWASSPSSMAGTTIGFDAVSNGAFIRIVDSALNSIDDMYISGERRSMKKIDKPSGLLDARAKRPRTIDDFLGWHQFVWLRNGRLEIRKDGEKYVLTTQYLDKPGVWKTEEGPCDLTPLPDRLGFTGFDRDNKVSFTYNEALKRFELTQEDGKRPPPVIRAPLARIPPPPSPEGGAAPAHVEIGIPSWH